MPRPIFSMLITPTCFFLCWRTGQSDILCAGKQRRIRQECCKDKIFVKDKFQQLFFIYCGRMLLKSERRRARQHPGMRIIWPKQPTYYFICVHISSWPADTTCIFIVELCLPLSSFMSRRIITHPKNNIKAELFFPGEYRYLLCGMHSAGVLYCLRWQNAFGY